MKRTLSVSLLGTLLALAACVTINVYFPAAAAEKAADRIIDDVWGKAAVDAPSSTEPQSALPASLLLGALDFLVSPAQAQQPNIDISSPAVQTLKASMEARFPRLRPFLESGAVGLSNDGLLAVRDAASVPLAQRNQVKSLVAEENNDRNALYREIAVANEQPQWEAQIRDVFAQRWIAKAQAGWWYQNTSGAWTQK